MSQVIGTFQLVDAMKAEGFPIPDRCREARLVMTVDSAFVVQYDVFLTAEDLVRLGNALKRVAGKE